MIAIRVPLPINDTMAGVAVNNMGGMQATREIDASSDSGLAIRSANRRAT